MAQCQDVSACLEANGSVSIDASLINDGSFDACDQNVSVSHQSPDFTCQDLGPQIIYLIAEDDAGLTDTCQATVTIQDCGGLNAQCRDLLICLDPQGQASVTPQQIDNGSTAACGLTPTLTIDQSSFNCQNLGLNSVQLTVEDDSGNTAACVSTVTIEDCTAPTPTCQDITLCLDNLGNASLSIPQVHTGTTDACDQSPALSLSQTSFSCSDIGTNQIQLTATDSSGNQGSCSSSVTILDCLSSCEPSGTECPETLTVADNPIQTGTYQAGLTLSASGIVPAPEDVILTAGQTVTLTPGFHAQPGSALHVLIDDCLTQEQAFISETTIELTEEVPQENRVQSEEVKITIFPNPFSNTATLRYSLPASFKTLEIAMLDLTGRQIVTVATMQEVPAGAYEIQLQAAGIKPGVYLIVLKGEDVRVIEKLIIAPR